MQYRRAFVGVGSLVLCARGAPIVLALICPNNLLTCGGTPAPPAADADRDGFTVEAGDCDNANPARSPGLLERCGNAIDDNCDAQIDEPACVAFTVVPIPDLRPTVVRQVSIDLAWTAVATQPPPGSQLRYDLRQSNTAFDTATWETAASLPGVAAPGAFGQAENFTLLGLSPAATYYVAVRLIDASNQVYAQSPTLAVTTVGVDQPTPDGAGMAGDTTPPPPVTDFYAVPSYSSILLRWTLPQGSDAVRLTVVRNAGATPVNPADGTVVYGGWSDTATDSAVQSGVTYYYAAYTLDHRANVSAPATVVASALEPPGDGSVVADAAGRLYLVDGGELLPLPPTVSRYDLGLDAAAVVALPAAVIQQYPQGTPLTASAAELLKRIDPDHDQLSNYDELNRATDPGDPDTDFDSYYDGVEVASGHDPLAVPPTRRPDPALQRRLAGRIVLQVERQGQAWWVHPAWRERYYLRDGTVAYQIMRHLSLGITNHDLAKIPRAGTDDAGDPKLVARLSGQMLLAVEDLGKVWYLNPANGRRYYLRDGDAAYWLMRYRSLGISNKNIEKIPIGTLRGKLK